MAEEEATGTSIDDPILGRMVLGKYRVVRRLGGGGMGSVYLLHHVELPDTFAALKVLGGDAGLGVEMRERFRQEALVAAAVGSHRVVRPLDVGEFDDGVPYIVMEYVEGLSLSEELAAHGPMPVAAALLVALRVADTMAIAHAKSIVHRDLKPPNIMLVQEGDDRAVKLLDFGVARASGTLKVAHTAESVIVGTPGYMSPEAVSGLSVDGRTDVFSLGVTLFEILTGELPFPAPSVQDAILNVLKKEPAPSVWDLRPAALDEVPESVERLIARALEKDMLRRPVMAQLHRELRDALEQMPSGKAARLPSQNLHLRPTVTDSPTLAKAPPQDLVGRFHAGTSGGAEPVTTRMQSNPSNPTIILLNKPQKKPRRTGLLAMVAVAGVALVAGGIGLSLRGGQGEAEREVEMPAPPVPPPGQLRHRTSVGKVRSMPGAKEYPPAVEAQVAAPAPAKETAPVEPEAAPSRPRPVPAAEAAPVEPPAATEKEAEAGATAGASKGGKRERRTRHGEHAHAASTAKPSGKPADKARPEAESAPKKPMERFVDPFAAPAFGTTPAPRRPAPRPASGPPIKESLDEN